jgi:hypothetical protein
MRWAERWGLYCPPERDPGLASDDRFGAHGISTGVETVATATKIREIEGRALRVRSNLVGEVDELGEDHASGQVRNIRMHENRLILAWRNADSSEENPGDCSPGFRVKPKLRFD